MNPSSVDAVIPRGFFGLWILLTFIWAAANATLAIETIATGAVISGVLAYIFSRTSGIWRGLRITPSSLYHFACYTGVFLAELVRANLNMLRYVYAPRIAIRPGIVKVNTKLKSPLGRLALANSIALTPGSLVMEIRDDTLFIHLLDVETIDSEAATRKIVKPFEAHLERVFG